MLKINLALATVALSFVAGSALAQTATTPSTAPMTMSCTEADMAKMNAQMANMDATKKTGAMREMGMAKEMMAKNDTAGCMTHMNNAMNMMK